VLNRQLHPHLDTVVVSDLTTEGVDSLYSYLLARGGASGQALLPGTVKRVHVVLSSAGDGSGTTQQNERIASLSCHVNLSRLHPGNSSSCSST
jgi:hypothetical protein